MITHPAQKSFWLFRRQLGSTLASLDSFDDREYQIMWHSVLHKGGIYRAPQLITYINERHRFQARWIRTYFRRFFSPVWTRNRSLCRTILNDAPTHYSGPLKELDIPVHVLWGFLDAVAPPEIAKQLHEDIPQSKLTMIDHVGHYGMLEDPTAWADAALQFWSANRSNRA